MYKKYKIRLIAIISLLFIAWVILTTYTYSTWFDFNKFFLSLSFTIYYKVGIIILLYLFRNYLFVPSTIIIIIAWLIFKDFFLTATVSMVWVCIWLIQTYFIWYFIWGIITKKKVATLVKKNSKEIKESWAKVIFLGAMSPILPTDLICYAAGLIKYNFIKFFIAATLWELPIVILYAYLGVQAEKYTNYFIYFVITSLLALGIYYYIKNKRNNN